MIRTISLILFLFLSSEFIFGQITHTDSTITVNDNFSIREVNNGYFLVPQFNSTCLVKDKSYTYHYDRGEHVINPPYEYYIKAGNKHSIDTIFVDLQDTVITIFYLGSVVDKYYTLSAKRKSDRLVLTVFDLKGKSCVSEEISKSKVQHIIAEENVHSIYPPYDCFSRLIIVLKREGK
ncbi:MAG: hypothetical protein IPP51_17995 [Bacteroidetes bacterium]|nr:hypothetical protein [Bacteroidota bacterium]